MKYLKYKGIILKIKSLLKIDRIKNIIIKSKEVSIHT